MLLISLLMAGGVGWMVYHNVAADHRQQIEENIQLQMAALRVDMQLELGHFSHTLSFLVDQVELRNPLQSAALFDGLSEEFLSFVRSSPSYDQVRLLDMSGAERIRINYNNGSPILVQGDDLQNKADRYYFKEGIKLKRGEVYVSPFDLNIEGGKLEMPIKPTIRLVQPAFDKGGQKIGLVVVNVLGSSLLAHIDMQTRELPANYISLLNRDGYWLAGPVKDDLWGFMYRDRKDRSMAARSPALWQQIRMAETARIVADDGVYLSDTFYPADVFNRLGMDVKDTDALNWKLVTFYSDAFMSERLSGQFQIIFLTSIGAAVALAIILFVLLRLQRQSVLRKQAEEMAYKQAMESEKTKSIVTIAGGVAHEFNNILTGILGSSYLMRSEVEGSPVLKERLDDIDSLGKRAAELVQHLMAFAQIGLRENVLLSLNVVVADVLERLERELPEVVYLDVDITKTPLLLHTDKSKLEEMLWHLFENAVDAVAGSDVPEILVSLQLEERPSGPHFACLTVHDNGEGIAAENLAHIFDPFFSTKQTGDGMGMGLALVYGVVHALDGDIKVESSEGEGTTLRILLPLAAMDENDLLEV